MTPLILLIYNRPRKVAQMIEALRIFKPDPLYVFSDGPKSKQDQSAVMQCRDLVYGRIDWTEPEIIERRHNIGLAKSVVGAMDMVLDNYRQAVLLEDDCIPGPYFMEYMELCLDKYKFCSDIMCITGYTVPIPRRIRDQYPWDVYFIHRIGSWGWGTWRWAWKLYQRDLQAAYDTAIAKGIDLEQCGRDAAIYIKRQLRVEHDTWTPNWVLTLYNHNAHCVYPTVSHIQNIGFDGTGVHCGASKKYDTPLAKKLATRLPNEPTFCPQIFDTYRRFYP